MKQPKKDIHELLSESVKKAKEISKLAQAQSKNADNMINEVFKIIQDEDDTAFRELKTLQTQLKNATLSGNIKKIRKIQKNFNQKNNK